MRYLPILLAAVLTGCTTVPERPSPAPFTVAETSAVVTDCAGLLTGHFPAVKTTFAVTGFPLELSSSVTEALRAQGYAIAEPGVTAGTTTFAISLDLVDASAVLLRIKVGTTWTATRLYTRDAAGFTADTPFSILIGDLDNG